MISETLIGVIIGGAIGLAGNALNIFHSKKQRKREKKEATYLKAIDITTRYYAEIPKSTIPGKLNIPDELRVEYNSIKSSMTIYGTEEIYEHFKEIIIIILQSKEKDKEKDKDSFNEKFEEFSEMIIKDLNK